MTTPKGLSAPACCRATADRCDAQAGERIWQFKASTDLWTGSVTLEEKNGQIKAKTGPDRLITTGLLGSIRWWFEVLVRGLGGHACDPTKTKCEGRNHCVVCELFGCTGWARKFRFDVLDEKGKIKTDQIKQDKPFSLRFTPLRPICIEEWTLLDATLRLIAEYGAIGGKTVFKPTGEPGRASKLHHKDFGLVQITQSPQIAGTGRGNLETYLSKWWKVNHGEFAWASLQNFWFVDGKTLSRENADKSTFNKVLGRKEEKTCRAYGKVHNPSPQFPQTKKHPKRFSEQLVNGGDKISGWLAGSQRESKKVFSFKEPARTFGFAKPGLIDFVEMKKRLQGAWHNDGLEFLTGDTILDQLFAKEEDRS